MLRQPKINPQSANYNFWLFFFREKKALQVLFSMKKNNNKNIRMSSATICFALSGLNSKTLKYLFVQV